MSEMSDLGDFFNVTEQLLDLQDKTFYIEIWGGYAGAGDGCNYTRMPGFFKLFTGLCPGGSIEYSYGKRIMTCKIMDYTKILKDQRLFNSPFFDGVKDCDAISELLTMTGFRSAGIFDPAFLLNQMMNNSYFIEQRRHLHLDGRNFRTQPYTLPSEYAILDQAAFKFADGSTYYECISNITKRASKVFFFDQHGIAHYEDFQDMVMRVALGEEQYTPLFEFTTNPDNYDGQLIFNKLEESFNMEDVYNHIKMFSTSPDREALLIDRLDWNSFDNPDIEGFVGYLKTFYQQDGMFGSEEAVKNISNFYQIMFRPPIKYSFETYGLPIRALDIISVDGQASRIVNVNHSLDPQKNEWWMQVECERFQPLNRIE